MGEPEQIGGGIMAELRAIAERARTAKAQHAEQHPGGCGQPCRWCYPHRAPEDEASPVSVLDLATKAGIPSLWREMFRRGQPEGSPAVRVLEKTTQRVAVLSGPSGCGKSTAAYWFAWCECRRAANERAPSASALCLDAADLMRISIEEDDRFERARRVRLLVLDDLGWDYQDRRGYGLHVLGRILDAREKAQLRLVCTTNLAPKPKPGTDPEGTLWGRLGETDQERERMWRRLGGDAGLLGLRMWEAT